MLAVLAHPGPSPDSGSPGEAQLSGQDDVDGQGKDYERDHREEFADGSLPLNAVAAFLRVGLNFRCIV
ncbi:hypothetical protein ACFV90_14885 [Streptomyces sp. NPDC059904]|uniref:hypothetical protein n=1 Tax=unclassified Streptomyces TaxID=2593676 RepID=UPI003653732E